MALDLPAVPLVLDRKDPGLGHVVVGDLESHVGFLVEVLGEAEVIPVAKLEDLQVMDRLGRPGAFVYTLTHERGMAIASDTRAKVSLWSARAIKKRSAGLRVLCRRAVTILGMEEVEKERLDVLGDQVIDQLGDDAPPQAMIWAAIWLLTDPQGIQVADAKNWKHPWEHPWNWLPKGVPLAVRLHVLYRDLAGWVFARDDDRKGAERLGITPSKFQWLKQVRLSDVKVHKALLVLSAWRAMPDEGYTTALQISAIFEA